MDGKTPPETIYSAMAKAFAEIEAATKTVQGQVGQQKYKYADLASVIDAIKPALVNHGLFFFQKPEPSERGVTIETIIGHAGGESMSLGSLFVPANKADAQGYGSALTYARRYALVTAFGVPVEDDDGNAAVKSHQSAQATPKAEAPKEMPDAEWAKLTQLIKATGLPVAGLLKKYKVESLKHLSQDQYAAAIEGMTNILAEKAKAETNAAQPEGFGEVLADEIPY